MRSILPVVLFLAAVGVARSPAADPPAAKPDKDHDFGDKILYVVSKPKDDKGESTYALFEKVKVVRLGDRAFLVGQIPDYGEGEAAKLATGKKVWTPISDIVHMTEFASVDEAKKYFDTARKEGEKPGR